MAIDYTQHTRTRFTPAQAAATPVQRRVRKDQVVNNTGGLVFATGDWMHLQRFLILGSEGGTYYVTERKLTRDAAKVVERCLADDGPRTVQMIVDISDSGRAPRNDAAIFALAMAAKLGDVPTRTAAYQALPKVCRIGTHLFHFVRACEAFGGWGMGLRKAVARWYTERPVDNLLMQLVKYQQRDGWAHRDLIRLSHVKATDAKAKDRKRRNDAFAYAVRGTEPFEHIGLDFGMVYAAEEVKYAKTAKQVIAVLRDFQLPRECIPTQFLNDPSVWQAMLDNGMPMTALIRNLGKMSSIGMLDTALSPATKQVVAQLTDATALTKARVHPVSVLAALLTYRQGRGVRGNLSWRVNGKVVDALDDAFYLAFGGIKPTGKNFMLGIDVSGSMSAGIAGVPGMTCRDGAVVMAMVVARTEPWCEILGFNHQVTDLGITAKDTLPQALQKASRWSGGSTDCGKLFDHARTRNIDVDAFVTITDNETNTGAHPFARLQQYRAARNPSAKSVVVGMVATHFTVADPNDAGSLDVVGFDTNTPQVISGFVSG